MTPRAIANLAAVVLVAVLLAGCGPGTPVTRDGTAMLRYGFMTGGPTALTRGTLLIGDGCIRIEPGPDASQVVLWPSSASLENVEGRLSVVLGGVFAFDGDAVALGGGEQKDQAWVEHLVRPVPEPCISDIYWMATTLEVL